MSTLAVAFSILTLVCITLGLLWELYKVNTKYHRLTRGSLDPTRMPAIIPLGSKYFYELPTGAKCRRCPEGRVFKRYRHQLVSGSGGETVVRKLKGFLFCNSCSFRMISLVK